MDHNSLTEYKSIFPQFFPRYAVKQIGGTWRTKHKNLSDKPIKAHLEGRYYIASLGRWYPEYMILDIDDQPKEKAEQIREDLKLDTQNSMLFSSESENSYHILCRPNYKEKPPTINLLNQVLKSYSKESGIEVYPQAQKPVRLPFGYKQDCLDLEYVHLKSWEEKLYWFLKLDYFDLETIPFQQLSFDVNVKPENKTISTYQEGKRLFVNGLLEPHSRHDSQWKVIYYLWRQNIALKTAIDITYKWITEKHNGLSEEVLRSPRTVKGEIERQAKRIYGHYQYNQIYPDSTHNCYGGYITKDDITDIIFLSKGSLPKAKFLFNLIKFAYPRRFRTFINIHSNHLIAWSQRGYLKQLKGLQKAGIIKRYDSYQVKQYSKGIKLNWNFRDVDKAILSDNRAPEEFADTVKISYEPEEFRELLRKAGSKRTNAIMAVKSVFEGVKNV